MRGHRGTQELQPPAGERDHAQGPATASATLVEYGDYECPYCGSAYSTVKQLRELLGERLRFVFRNFPLADMHPQAEAAGGQGRFWEMHDLLYENQEHLEEEDLRRYARELKLDEKKLEQELASHAYVRRIEEDLTSGERSGIPGTPAFFINGTPYRGPYDLEMLLAAVESAERHPERAD